MSNYVDELFEMVTKLHSIKFEIWIPVKGYDNYFVSSWGKIKNCKGNKILKTAINSGGYLVVGLSKNGVQKMHTIHKLVANNFLFNHLKKPCVDHKDNNRKNNHINNLRFATFSENQQNKSKQSNNTSGTTGVSWHKQHQKWCTHIHIDGKRKHLGLFTSKTKAIACRKAAEAKYFGEFAHKNN